MGAVCDLNIKHLSNIRMNTRLASQHINGDSTALDIGDLTRKCE